jgi:hypothetical protein
LNTGLCSSQRLDSPVEIGSFPKAEARQRKSRVSAILTDTPVKAAFEAEVEACSEPVKRNRSFSDSQENTRKSKQLKKNFLRVESSDEEDDNECFCIEYAETYSTSIAHIKWFQCSNCINEPTIVAPNLETTMFAGNATLMTLMTSCLKIDVKW